MGEGLSFTPMQTALLMDAILFLALREGKRGSHPDKRGSIANQMRHKLLISEQAFDFPAITFGRPARSSVAPENLLGSRHSQELVFLGGR